MGNRQHSLIPNIQQDNWEKWLDQVEYVQNTWFHEAIQESLFFLMHRYNPWNGIEMAIKLGNKTKVAYYRQY